MKNMKFSRVFIPVCALLFAACTSENDSFVENTSTSETPVEDVLETSHVVFTASTDEGDDVTRATFKNLVMGWESGDKISVVQSSVKASASELKATNLAVKDIEGSCNQTAKFEGDMSVNDNDVFWAVYSKNATQGYNITSSNRKNVGSILSPSYVYDYTTNYFSGQIPYAQTVLAGKEVDETAMYMTASTTAEEKIFRFKNLTSLLKINIKSGDGTTGKKVKYVRFVANDTNAKLTGAFTATIGTDGVATVTPGTTNNSVLLQANGDALNGTYYISVLPATLSGGFKILFETECTNYSQEIYVRKSSGNITLNRNEIVDLGSYDATATGTVNGAKGIKESFISDVVDLDLPTATLWAAKNIAAGDKVFVDNVNDYGQYYGWGEDFGFDEEPTHDDKSNKRDDYVNMSVRITGSVIFGGNKYEGKKIRYEWTEYKWCTNSNLLNATMSKYTSSDKETELSAADDIAQKKTNGKYSMPTQTQFAELSANTTKTNRALYTGGTSDADNAYVNQGYKYTSKLSGKAIWLPAAGSCYGALLDGGTKLFLWSSDPFYAHQKNVGRAGFYWSKTRGSNEDYAYRFVANDNSVDTDRRYAGCTIRPVLVK